MFIYRELGSQNSAKLHRTAVGYLRHTEQEHGRPWCAPDPNLLLRPAATLAMLDSDPSRIWWAVGAILVTGSVVRVILQLSRDKSEKVHTSREAYHAFSSLMLNTRPPTTEWINMGWWTSSLNGKDAAQRTDDCQFPDAADQLARRVLSCLDRDAGSAAALSAIPAPEIRPQRVLDLGHGNGDSLLLISQLLKPDILHGVTSLSAQAQRAAQRAGNHARVFCADAVDWLVQSRDCLEQYDVIVAIDSAYHFSSRQRFFQAAHSRLAPGGKLLLFDLFAAYPYPPTGSPYFQPCKSTPLPAPLSWVHKVKKIATLALTGVSQKNLFPFAAYATELEEAGFQMTIADVTAHVFPGFSQFLRSLGVGKERFWRGGSIWEQFCIRMFGEVVDTWAHGGSEGAVRAGLVCAVKRSTSQLSAAGDI